MKDFTKPSASLAPRFESGSGAGLNLMAQQQYFVRQYCEPAEFFGVESRNRYAIVDSQERPIGYAIEQSTGFLGFLSRQLFGHWREFDITISSPERVPRLIAHHPFAFFFDRIEVKDIQGKLLGAIQCRFGIFTKRFDVENAGGQVILSVASPFLQFWTFGFNRGGIEVASVKKKWSGLFSEVFTDRDNFLVDFGQSQLTEEERSLVLCAAIYIDLMYFERQANSD